MYEVLLVCGSTVGWLAVWGGVRELCRRGRLGAAHLSAQHVLDLSFDHTNFVHAVVTTVCAGVLLAQDAQLRAMDPLVSVWSPTLSVVTAATIGYLVVDVGVQGWLSWGPLIAGGNGGYLAFHSVILVGFASCLWTRRGGAVVVWGLASEADSIVKGVQLQLELLARLSPRSSRAFQAADAAQIPLGIVQIVVFALTRVLVFWWLASALIDQVLLDPRPGLVLPHDPVLWLQSGLVFVGLAFNTVWCLMDVMELKDLYERRSRFAQRAVHRAS